jgi:hypothetical protein
MKSGKVSETARYLGGVVSAYLVECSFRHEYVKRVSASFLSEGLTVVMMEVPALITSSLCTFKTAVAQSV